jgi:hypothetical protein
MYTLHNIQITWACKLCLLRFLRKVSKRTCTHCTTSRSYGPAKSVSYDFFLLSVNAHAHIAQHPNHMGLRGHSVSRVSGASGWDLAEWLERCANIPKITGSNPCGGSELPFRSDLLLTARGEAAVRERSMSLLVCCVTRVTHSALTA